MTTPERTRARREFAAALLAAAIGGALLLLVDGRGWVRLTVPRDRPLSTLHRTISGADAQPLLTALGIVGLAAVVACLATARIGRTVVGVILAAAGIATLVVSTTDVRGMSADRALSLLEGAGPVVGIPAGARVTVDVHVGWVVAAVVAGVLLLAAGVVIAVRGRRWPAMGSRYERPAGAKAAAAEGPAADRQLWDALDRGDDPTVERDEPAARRQNPPG